MRIAIVGSRNYPHPQKVFEFVDSLPVDTEVVVSGGAGGVDSWAVLQAKRRKLPTKEFFADWSKGRGAGFARNQLIVDYADIIVAFWDGQSRGTLDTMRKADAAGKVVEVHLP